MSVGELVKFQFWLWLVVLALIVALIPTMIPVVDTKNHPSLPSVPPMSPVGLIPMSVLLVLIIAVLVSTVENHWRVRLLSQVVPVPGVVLAPPVIN